MEGIFFEVASFFVPYIFQTIKYVHVYYYYYCYLLVHLGRTPLGLYPQMKNKLDSLYVDTYIVFWGNLLLVSN